MVAFELGLLIQNLCFQRGLLDVFFVEILNELLKSRRQVKFIKSELFGSY